MQHTAAPADFLARFFRQMTADVLAGDDHATVVDRYHTPDVVQIADGITLDRQKLIDHLRPVQRTVTAFDVEVHEAVADGARLAARLTLRATSRGKPTAVYVHFFGEFTADGRLRRAHQLTKMLEREAR